MASHDVVTLSTITRWFVRKRGVMTGIVKVGAGAGQLIVSLIAAALITALDWRNSYLILGSATLVLFVLVAQFFRRDPQQTGLFPDGAKNGVSAPTDSREQGLSLDGAVRTRQFWTIYLAYFSVIYCLLTVIIHIVPHVKDVGASATGAAGVLSTIGGMSMVGRFTMGTASDRIGSKRAMIISLLVLIGNFLWLAVADELWMFYLFAVIYGFAHGGIFVVVPTMVAGLFGTRAHGVIFGIIYFAGTLGGAAGPVIAGRIFDIT